MSFSEMARRRRKALERDAAAVLSRMKVPLCDVHVTGPCSYLSASGVPVRDLPKHIAQLANADGVREITITVHGR